MERVTHVPPQTPPEPGPLDPDVVHTLSNHLSVILGFVQIMIDELPPDDPRQKDLIEIRDAAAASAKLIGRG